MNIEKAVEISSVNQAGYVDTWGRFHLYCLDTGYWVRNKGEGKEFKHKPGYPRPSRNWRPIAP